MSQDSSTSRASPPPAPSAEKKALLDAFDTVLKTQAEEREADARDAEARRRARAGSRPLLATCAVILLAISAYLSIMQPTWVFAPQPTPESLALKEASLRIAIANASQHVRRFQQRNSRLPESLAEAGARGGDMVYNRVGASSYRLVGENGPTRVTLTSDDSLAAFLGNSFQIIARRSR
jgi:hypothetical protein